jgi:hypothetical protein
MRKRTIGGAFITAAAVLSLELPHTVNNPEVAAGQVLVTLVDMVDGDKIKVRMNAKAETVFTSGYA